MKRILTMLMAVVSFTGIAATDSIQVSGSSIMGGGIVLSLDLTPTQSPLFFYGLTSAGGVTNGVLPNGNGCVFKIDSLGNYTRLYAFPFVVNQEVPCGGLIRATDGFMYGITQDGGTHANGTLIRVTTNGVVTVIHNFLDAVDGGFPNPNLIQASDGNLYGMCSQGGSATDGTLFKCSTGGTFTTLHNFTGAADGGQPLGTVMQANDGNLYGTASGGGANNSGIIFRSTLGGTFTTMYDFSNTGATDGRVPLGDLIQATDGNLYGTCNMGGSSDKGSIFKCTLGGSLTLLHSLIVADGTGPCSNPYQATDGDLYGLSRNGGVGDYGTLWKITTSGTFTVLHVLDGPTEGQWPDGPVIQASDGRLYGCTYLGGTSSRGSIFNSTTTGTFTVMHAYDIVNGAIPTACKLLENNNTWVQSFGGTGADIARTVTVDTQGNSYVAGTFSGTFTFGNVTLTSAGGRDMFLAKFNNAGSLLWVYGYGSTGDEVPQQIMLGASGNIYVCGLFLGTANFGGTNSTSGGGTDGFIAKYTSSGVFTWSKAIGGTGDDNVSGIALDSTEAKVLATGMFTGTVVFTPTNTFASQSGGNDSYMAAYTVSGGTPIWAETWGSLDYDTGINIFCDTNNNVTVMGAFAFRLGTNMLSIQSYTGTRDTYLGKFFSVGNNAPGVATWARGYGTLNNTIPTCATLDNNGDILVGGTFISQSDLGGGVLVGTGSYSTFLAKYSKANGGHTWSRAVTSTWTVSPSRVIADNLGNPIFCGAFSATCNFGGQSFTEVGNNNNGDGFVAKYNRNTGAPIWAQTIGGTGSDSCLSIGIDSANYSTVVGFFSGSAIFGSSTLVSSGATDIFVQRLAP